MIDVEPLLEESFARLYPVPVVTPDWEQVLAGAGLKAKRSPRRFSRRRLALSLALVLAGVLAAAAFATGIADRFSAWVAGSPGGPAPASEQRGFEQRNRVAYASFAAGTRLRLLLRRSVDDASFSLLGFRNGDAYCLRLIRSELPNGVGRNECLRAEELSGVPALVAGDAWFSVGEPARSINGLYGFASDDVRALLITRARGSEQVAVVNNVFLSLRGQRAGTVQQHLLPNPVLTVSALMRDGRSLNVPYVAEGRGIFSGGRRPSVPSYFGRGATTRIPGPTRVTAPIAHPQIGWLERREPRGQPLPQQRHMSVGFGRVVQPDPDDPIRVGIATAKIIRPPGAPRLPQSAYLCLITFEPLSRGAGSGACMPQPFKQEPLALGSWLQSPVTHFNGLAADGVSRVTAYLSSGRTVQAALRDNVFAVALPETELPGKLVAYDAHGRVAGVLELPGNPVAKPCPAATLSTPTSQLPRPLPWQRIDLATLRVNGQTILGKTPAEIEAALGRPTRIIGTAQIENGVAIPEFRYGGASPTTVGLMISFSKKGDRIFAYSLSYQSPSLVDARLGHLLRLQPEQLQHAISATYGSKYRLFLQYGADTARGCMGDFLDRRTPKGIAFGLDPWRPSRPYLLILANGAG